MRFPAVRGLIDWFKKLSLQRKILMSMLAILLFLSLPWLYQELAGLYGRASCSLNGGEWKRVGLAQSLACVHTYPDAGKTCKSSDECEGYCVIYDPPIRGQPLPGGLCKGDNLPYGCFAVIEYPETYSCTD